MHNNFENNIRNLYGDLGLRWLEQLPEIVMAHSKTLGLSDLKPVSNLSYNYVLSGFQGSQPIILKLGLDHNSLENEALALKCFEGGGSVRVLAYEEGLLLLERATPGTSLKTYFPYQEREAIDITCELIKRLHHAHINPSFPHVRDWLLVIDEDHDIPDQYLQKARKLKDHLLETAGPDVLLHGDLHHENILQSGDTWVAIDPKGVIGEQAYEPAAFIRNPIPQLYEHEDASNIIQDRIESFATNLNIPAQRISDWCFVQAVLCWCWALDDNLDPQFWKKFLDYSQDIKYMTHI